MYTALISREDLALIEAYAKRHKTPIFAVHSTGFYSYFRIYLPGTFPIMDTHPDETATTDLRLLRPWPELVEFAQEMTMDIDNLDDHKHGHLPYVVILLYYLEKWKETHGGAYPSTYAEKVAFRTTVQKAARTTNSEGAEENFDEAVAAVLKTIAPPTLPSGAREVFEYQHSDPVCAPNYAADSVQHWRILTGLHRLSRTLAFGSSPMLSRSSMIYTACCRYPEVCQI
jgi:amyloid beta precursor protein binding protein 1